MSHCSWISKMTPGEDEIGYEDAEDDECAHAANILADLAASAGRASLSVQHGGSSSSDSESDSMEDENAGLDGLFKTKMTTKDEVNVL